MRKLPVFLLLPVISLISSCNTLLQPQDIFAFDRRNQEIPEERQSIQPGTDIASKPANVPLAEEIEQNSSIWPVIQSGFQLPDKDHADVNKHLDWFIEHPEYLDRVFTRAQRYLYHVTEETRKKNYPTEIALLPVVESAYNPYAYSPGRASGLWQFIPGTGKRFGLKENWWYSGRRDVIASTDAALKYLDYLFLRYKGDWLLALAAYNAGEGNVDRAIRKNHKNKKPTDFWHLSLPKETQHYVPKLLALAKVVSNPEAYGITLKEIPNAPYFASVDTGGQIDLARVAELANTSVDEIYQLNPAFNQWATDPAGPHKVLIPYEANLSFMQQLAALDENERITWKRHKIGKGETLSQIAYRYRTNVALLKSINQLNSHRIRAGKYLIVPVSKESLSEYRIAAATPKISRAITKGKGRKITHTIQPGDTLWDIASNYDVSVNQLTSWNGISKYNPVKPGQQITIWLRDSNKLKANNSIQKVHYTVRKGDSLYVISRKFNVAMQDLRKWNQIGEYLQPGQKITLYVDVTKGVDG